MALPKFILLKSNRNNKLLCYRKEDDSHHAFLQFSQDEKEKNPEVQYAKFEVQKSKNVEGFVHIRSCYNHKYWVRKSADSKSIVAEANEPDENQSKWSCTLFRAVLIDDDSDEADADDFFPKPQKIRLVHADQLGQQACVQSSETTDLVIEDSGMTLRAPDEDIFIAYNAASVFVLPEYVAFMGPTDKYGAPTAGFSVNGLPLKIVRYLEFKTTDLGHDGVIHLLDQSPLNNPPFLVVKNTSLAVSTDFWAGFWRTREGNSYITMDADTLTFIELFVPINISGNSLAFRLYDHARLFTNSIKATVYGTNDGTVLKDQVLGATATSIDASAILRVVEPVLRREVSNVVFTDSRVYNVGQVQKFTDERRNATSLEQTGVFRVSYTRTQAWSWNDSVSVTRTVMASWSSKIPFVGEFGVEYSDERTQTVEWGKEMTEVETIEYEQSVTIPPGKKITLSVIASGAECDVPFRCQVRDTMTDGTIRTYTKRDGLFVGANEFNVQTLLFEDDL